MKSYILAFVVDVKNTKKRFVLFQSAPTTTVVNNATAANQQLSVRVYGHI